ncbi:hypothetical protein F4821DRAFT_239869 [Hypoxylon rubiginosum]|uniref:Uncharacterized protein n=1 Tax=Hypoxylon rubiginosum TaxID=110542 RepID=A0ACC0CZC5_9PEZI|nr:hypothetical protein F4821DRAFT_239869 [Hypoxylon rubiginosum]
MYVTGRESTELLEDGFLTQKVPDEFEHIAEATLSKGYHVGQNGKHLIQFVDPTYSSGMNFIWMPVIFGMSTKQMLVFLNEEGGRMRALAAKGVVGATVLATKYDILERVTLARQEKMVEYFGLKSNENHETNSVKDAIIGHSGSNGKNGNNANDSNDEESDEESDEEYEEWTGIGDVSNVHHTNSNVHDASSIVNDGSNVHGANNNVSSGNNVHDVDNNSSGGNNANNAADANSNKRNPEVPQSLLNLIKDSDHDLIKDCILAIDPDLPFSAKWACSKLIRSSIIRVTSSTSLANRARNDALAAIPVPSRLLMYKHVVAPQKYGTNPVTGEIGITKWELPGFLWYHSYKAFRCVQERGIRHHRKPNSDKDKITAILRRAAEGHRTAKSVDDIDLAMEDLKDNTITPDVLRTEFPQVSET